MQQDIHINKFLLLFIVFLTKQKIPFDLAISSIVFFGGVAVVFVIIIINKETHTQNKITKFQEQIVFKKKIIFYHVLFNKIILFRSI